MIDMLLDSCVRFLIPRGQLNSFPPIRKSILKSNLVAFDQSLVLICDLTDLILI